MLIIDPYVTALIFVWPNVFPIPFFIVKIAQSKKSHSESGYCFVELLICDPKKKLEINEIQNKNNKPTKLEN